MSRTVALYNMGEVYATDEEMATFLDLAITLLHSRSIKRADGVCDSQPTIDEMNRVLSKLNNHPVEDWSLRFVPTASLPPNNRGKKLRLVSENE